MTVNNEQPTKISDLTVPCSKDGRKMGGRPSGFKSASRKEYNRKLEEARRLVGLCVGSKRISGTETTKPKDQVSKR
jgi:hypothetical protein